MRILITNNTLAERAGTELYVRDIALALLARGHQPIAYSQALGRVADELRAATVPVLDNLHRVAEPPHVIHGHHHLETMTVIHHFPGVPAVFFCHGWAPWQEAPPAHPRIVRYVAVDEVCRQRLVHEGGVPPEKTEVLLNFVDLGRFRPRPPLPRECRRALIYSNHAGSAEIADAVRAACDQSGVALDVVGLASGNPTDSPETLLPKYDLVFAKGRAALEAMAVGCAVVLCDSAGSGPLVGTGNFDTLRAQNFGLRSLSSPLSAEVLAGQIERFDRDQAAAVSARVRSEASLIDTVDRLITMYEEAVASAATSPQAEGRAAADYIRALAPRIKENDQLHRRLDAAAAEVSALRDELGCVQGSLTWRLRERALGTRVGRFLCRLIARSH